MSKVPACRIVQVFAFRGDRTAAFAATFLQSLDDERLRLAPGPSILDCLLYSGHTGVSLDLGTTVYGFNPDRGSNAIWQLMDGLKNGDAFPGVVSDDTSVFKAASAHGLRVRSFQLILPDPQFLDFQKTLDADRPKSKYSYGFPNGDGDCNCTTWLERLGLPLLTGRMNEFLGLPSITSNRRFGLCV